MLEKLEVSEAKYSYALDDAKIAFAVLQEQAKEFDARELYEVRLSVRNGKEQDAECRLQNAYGAKFNPDALLGGRHDVEILLNEKQKANLTIQEENFCEQQAIANESPRHKPKNKEMGL